MLWDHAIFLKEHTRNMWSKRKMACVSATQRKICVKWIQRLFFFYAFWVEWFFNNSKLNITKDQFRIRFTKRTHSEPLMAPKLPTSQIFKGRAYELIKVSCISILFEQKTSRFTPASRSNFFKTRKNYYIAEICKNSKITPLRMHQKHNRWIHFTQIFLCVAETHAIFLLLHMFL